MMMLRDQSEEIQRKLQDIGEGMGQLHDRHPGDSGVRSFQISEEKVK